MDEDQKVQKEQGERKTTNCLIITGFIIVGILWIASWLLLLIENPDNRGSIGDMFGAVNALFSGLAFAGIIITILLQKRELALQREELVLTREELKRTANAQETSGVALKRQAENLKISAKLSALNTLIDYYREVAKKESKFNAPYVSTIKDRITQYVSQIEEILDNKNI